jgi:hypothetical protein
MTLFKALLERMLKQRGVLSQDERLNRRVMGLVIEDCANYIRMNRKEEPVEEDELALLKFSYKVDKVYFVPKKLPAFKEEIGAWSGLWTKKWFERVVVTPNKPPSTSTPPVEIEERLIRLQIKAEILAQLVPVTIKCGEFCGTKLLPVLAVKQQLTMTTETNPIKLIQTSAETIRALSQTHGPLIYITL